MGTERRRIILATAGVFILLTSIFVIAAGNSFKRDSAHTFAQAELNAKVYTGELERDFEQGIAIAKAVEEVVISGQGQIPRFRSVAENLMEHYIGSIQIAPDGVVTDIYPMAGNEGGLIDLIHDPDRGPVVAYGIEHDAVTMQGPFDLKQGGSGIAVRDPVFLTDVSGNRSFWGFTIVIIKAPDIFRQTFESLESFGYDYILSTTISPVSDEYRVVAASRDILDHPVAATFRKGECTWRLEVAPKSGWRITRESLTASIIGALFVVLLTVTFAALMVMFSQRKRLSVMAETDPLTGLLNRKGRVDRIDRYLKSHPDGAATEVFLDIDDFKIINDLYGHDIGDEALKNLARNLVGVFDGAAVVSRTGGDEFGVFIPGRTAEQSEPLIHAASAQDQTFTTAQGKSYTYTISMGYADYPAQARTREELARNVDSALYNVKLNGKHGCQRYVAGMIKQSREQFGFTQKELLKRLPGAGLICRTEDATILYANEDLVRLFECDNLEDFNRFSLGRLKNVVHPEDYGAVVAAHRGKGEDEGLIVTRLRVVTRTGRVKRLIAQARFRHHESFGDLYYVTAMALEDD